MKQTLLHCRILLAAVAFTTLAGCGSDYSTNSYGGNPPPPTDSNTVNLGASTFSPNSKTITVGTTITWKNASGTVHTSTSDTGVWDTGNIPAGGSKTTTFTAAGTFPYHCTYHQSMGMTGTIVVH
jgi:plastocyanin